MAPWQQCMWCNYCAHDKCGRTKIDIYRYRRGKRKVILGPAGHALRTLQAAKNCVSLHKCTQNVMVVNLHDMFTSETINTLYMAWRTHPLCPTIESTTVHIDIPTWNHSLHFEHLIILHDIQQVQYIGTAKVAYIFFGILRDFLTRNASVFHASRHS